MHPQSLVLTFYAAPSMAQRPRCSSYVIGVPAIAGMTGIAGMNDMSARGAGDLGMTC